MVVLDVDDLLYGVNQVKSVLIKQSDGLRKLEGDVLNLISLDDALKGKGGQSIRRYYQNYHIPILKHFQVIISEYENILTKIIVDLQSMESHNKGYIKSDYLESEILEELNELKNSIFSLVADSNDILSKVSDIIYLPALNEEKVSSAFIDGENFVNNTVDKLHVFDREQVNRLTSIETEINIFNNYITEMRSVFNTKDINIKNEKVFSILKDINTYKSSQTVTGKKISIGALNNEEKEEANSLEINPYAPITGVGNTFGTVAEATVISRVAYQTSVKGFQINKYDKGYKVKNGHVVGIAGKDYQTSWIKSQVERGNTPKIAQYVNTLTAAKDAVKSKLGWVGIGITSTENLYKNVQSGESATKTIGDAVVDVSIGVATIVGGAVIVSAVVGLGAPVLVGAVIGAGISVGAAYLFEGVKINGKTVSDNIKDGLQKGVKAVKGTIAGWFKKKEPASNKGG